MSISQNKKLELSKFRLLLMADEEKKSVQAYFPEPSAAGVIIPSEQRLTYTWYNLNVFPYIHAYKLKLLKACLKKYRSSSFQRRQILKNVCGVAYPGELLVVLGSSGSGKTTLLNALTFHSPSNVSVTGSRCINGVMVSLNTFTSQSAYVQQEDLFIGNLTVKEHLVFQALVRMDRNLPYKKRMKRVEEVMSELALTDCQNARIGNVGRDKGISGGEKKRLAFAAEVLTNPKMMFCDEPTSGLDSYMALHVVTVLKNMALAGKTIMCTIHQPSSEIFMMFDKLLLMSEGRTAFLGSPDEADEFFTDLNAPCPVNFNPADYYVRLLAIVPEYENASRDGINTIIESYEDSLIGRRNLKVAEEAARLIASVSHHSHRSYRKYRSPYKASYWGQFKAVMWRSWLSTIREPQLIRVRIIQTILIALIIGVTYFDQEMNQKGIMNLNGAMFVILTTMTFQNVFAVLNVFSAEIEIFFREHRNGMYQTDIYFVCKTICEIPIFVITPIIFMASCYYLIGLNPDITKNFKACFIVVLVSNVATSFGYFISCAAPNVSMALSVGPALVMPLILFGGYLLNIGSIPIYLNWFSYLSWFRFGFESLMINQWKNVTGIDCENNPYSCLKDGTSVLTYFDFPEEHYDLDIVALIVLFLGYRVLAYIILVLRTFKRS